MALESFTAELATALDAHDVACFMLALNDQNDDVWRQATKALGPIAQSRDVAFVLLGHDYLVLDVEADGAHIEGSVEAGRASLPDDRIVGAGCGSSRHDAMIAGEAGADYVAFGPPSPDAQACLTWWQMMMEPPCVALGCQSVQQAVAAAEAGADFVALNYELWSDSASLAEIAAAVAKITRH